MPHTLTDDHFDALRYALKKALDIIGEIERKPAQTYTAPALERSKGGVFSDEVRQATRQRLRCLDSSTERIDFPHLTHGKGSHPDD